MYIYQWVYILQILHTASLVGQDYEKMIAMYVHLMYVLTQDWQTMQWKN